MSILSTHSAECLSIFSKSMIQSDDLPLADILDSSIVAEVFEEQKVKFGIADEDVYTPAIMLWAMISQMLHGKAARSCKAAAGRVVSLCAQVANRVVAQNAGNYCRAKAKIPVAAIREITLRLARQAEKKTIDFDDLGFPIVRCVALISTITGLLIDFACAPYSGKSDILVADSYYCTYWMIAMCKGLGVHLVMKNHHKRDDDPLGAKRISDTEREVTLLRPARPEWMEEKEYNQTPKQVVIRLIDVKIETPFSRTEDFTIATTMLDREQAPGEWVASLYHGRWIIEPDIRSIKCAMNLEHIRSQTPEGIEREIWTGLLTYNLVQLKMLQSAYASNREPRSMSFTESYQLMSTNWLLCAVNGVSEAMVIACLRQGTCSIVGNRPNRVEPRANKRRPKILKLMTIPRSAFKATTGEALVPPG